MQCLKTKIKATNFRTYSSVLQQRNKRHKKAKKMDIQTLLKNQNVTISVTGEQLSEFATQILDGARELYETKEQPEQYIPRKQTAQQLNVDLSTLWRWNREAYLRPVSIGGKRFYKLSDINRILGKGQPA